VSRLRRFLHIERSRADAPGSDPDDATARRIGGVEQPAGAPGAPARSGAHLDRFTPPPPASIELDRPEAGQRPFTRCQRCGMDHHVGVDACTGCGARLDTAEVRAANDRLWQERLAESAREAEADAARRAARAEADAEAAREQRAAAEAMAREIGEAERRRLDRELGPGGEVLRAGQRLLEWLLGG
jgi:ribosomal protein L37E